MILRFSRSSQHLGYAQLQIMICAVVNLTRKIYLAKRLAGKKRRVNFGVIMQLPFWDTFGKTSCVKIWKLPNIEISQISYHSSVRYRKLSMRQALCKLKHTGNTKIYHMTCDRPVLIFGGKHDQQLALDNVAINFKACLFSRYFSSKTASSTLYYVLFLQIQIHLAILL